MAEFFEEMDRDFDGKLSFEEFMGEETPLEKLFKSMDKEGKGTITKEVNNNTFNTQYKLFLQMPTFTIQYEYR